MKKQRTIDYRFMKHVTDMQIEKEINTIMTQDAIRQKQIQDAQDKHDAVIMIIATIIGMLVVGFLGG
jgi:hypothetical protein